MPYRDPQTNRTKLLAESTLSVIFTCTLAMRGDLAGEAIGSKGYARIMVYTMFIGAVLPTMYNICLAVGSYVGQLSKLQESLDQGNASQAAERATGKLALLQRATAAVDRLVKRFKKLYNFAVQLATAFEQLDDIVTNGSESGSDMQENAEDLAETGLGDQSMDVDPQELIEGLKSGETDLRKDPSADGEQAPDVKVVEVVDTVKKDSEGKEIPGVYLMDEITAQVQPIPALDFSVEQRVSLIALGYSIQKGEDVELDVDSWEAEMPPKTYVVNGTALPGNMFESQGDRYDTVKEAAKKLGFNSDNWRRYFVEKSYSAVVQKRDETVAFLQKKLGASQLTALWNECEQ